MADAVATLEGAETGLVFASGMGALATTVLGLVGRGDHIVAQRSMYGGSLSLVQKLLTRLGVDHTLVDQSDAGAWEGAITPATRLFLI
ncbi:MAG: cystathionine gamma-lyase, partial [Solirubrobacteraceae bacterium]|nr:cystathionine gamma-lyase [Solirubrobacteraceae bacterium]